MLAELSGEPELVDEGCLSVPASSSRVGATRTRTSPESTSTATPSSSSGTGLMAQALQHEVDHLDGHLYIEGLEPEVKREAMQLIRLRWSAYGGRLRP